MTIRTSNGGILPLLSRMLRGEWKRSAQRTHGERGCGGRSVQPGEGPAYQVAYRKGEQGSRGRAFLLPPPRFAVPGMAETDVDLQRDAGIAEASLQSESEALVLVILFNLLRPDGFGAKRRPSSSAGCRQRSWMTC